MTNFRPVDAPAQTIAGFLAAAAAARPDAPALLAPGRVPMTYGALLAEVQRHGDCLRRGGIGRGDVVMIAVPDGPEALAAILAVGTCATAFPVAAHEQPQEYERLVTELPIAAIIMPYRPAAPLASLAAQHGIRLHWLRAQTDSPAGTFTLDGPRAAAAAPSEPPALSDDAILISTSGATSRPKIVASTQASLFASIDHAARWMAIGPEDRSLCVMPFAHLHSIVRSTLPFLLRGGGVICAPGFDAAAVFGWMREHGATVMTAVPSIYRALLARIDAAAPPRVPGLRLLVTGSDKVEPETIASTARAFGVPVVQFYGLSEAAPLLAVSTAGDRALPPGAVGKVNPAWTLATVDDDGRALPAGAEGEIAGSGGHINRVVGRTAAPQRLAPDGRLLTGDIGRIDAEGYLYVTGRTGDRIHHGGKKIVPAAVEDVLASHPGVARAVVFGTPDAVMGERVAAVVVPKAGYTLDEKQLIAFAAERLASFKVPERIVVADTIPTTPLGKVARAAMAAALGLDGRPAGGSGGASAAVPEAAAPAAAPLDAPPAPAPMPEAGSLEDRIAAIYARHLLLDRVDRGADFTALGGDSFAAINVLLDIEEMTAVSIPPVDFMRNSSVAAIAAFVRRAPRTPESPLVPVQTGGKGPPLFVTHNLGGEVGFATSLAAALGPDQDVYAFHDPGKTDADAVPEPIEKKAARFVEHVRRVQPKGPYYLAGYSYGAHVAFEMARRLFASGEYVAFLAVIDDDADLALRATGSWRRPPKAVTRLTLNRWALNGYIPTPYPGRITLFRASAMKAWLISDPLCGWGFLATGGVDVHDIPGDHLSVVTGPVLAVWGRFLSLALAAARHRVAIAGPRLPAIAAAARAKALAYAKTPLVQNAIEARRANRRGDLAAEQRHLGAAIAAVPAPPAWLFHSLGDCLVESGQREAATAAYEDAIRREVLPLMAYLKLSRVLRELGRREAMDALYAQAMHLATPDPEIRRWVAQLCKALGRFGDAERALREAVAREPGKVEAKLELGYLLELQDRIDEAIAIGRECVRLAPHMGLTHMFLGRMHLRRKELDPAEACFQRALTTSKAVEAMGAMSIVEEQRGDGTAAIAWARKAAEAAPQEPDHVEYLAALKQRLTARGAGHDGPRSDAPAGAAGAAADAANAQ